MSNRQSTQIGVTFKPVPEPAVRVPREWFLVFGVIGPAVVIVFELISHMCADAFFDPMPTYWHVAAVSLVPASNLLLWYHLQDETGRTTNGSCSPMAWRLRLPASTRCCFFRCCRWRWSASSSG
jgi:hypothetical protein